MNNRYLLIVSSIVLLGASNPAFAGLISYTNEAAWLAAIGGNANITATENFDTFATDVSVEDTSRDFGPFTITASGSNSNNSFNIVDVPPYSNSQANHDGTPSYLGFGNVLIEFAESLSALSFSYLDSGASSQNYGLQVNFANGTNESFLLGNPGAAEFRGVVATAGMLIESVQWQLPSSPSPFSIDNVRMVGSAAVPEPGSLALALGGLALFKRQRKPGR